MDALGIGTKAVESVGLVLAVAAARAERDTRRSLRLAPLALALVVAVLAAAVTPAEAHDDPPGAAPHGH